MYVSDFELAHGECQTAFFFECQQCLVCRTRKALAEFRRDMEAQQEAEFEEWVRSMEEKASNL